MFHPTFDITKISVESNVFIFMQATQWWFYLLYTYNKIW